MGLSISISNSIGSTVLDAPAAGGGIITDNLVLHVDPANPESYPGSGTLLTDLTGNYNATLVNGVGFTSDDGGALVFDGVDDYGTFGNVLNFGPSNAWTVSIWFNNAQTLASASNIYGLISKRDINNVNGWTISMRGGSTYKGLLVRLSDTSTATTTDLIPSNDLSATLSNGRWHQLTLTFGLDDVARIYLDGSLEASATLTGFDFTNTRRLLLASTEDNVNFPVGQFPLNGKLSEVLIYDDELSADEVLSNYNATASRFIPAAPPIVTQNLIFNVDVVNPLSYPGSGTTLTDLVNNLTGTLVNGVVFDPLNGGSLVFDGVDDHVDLGSVNSSNPLMLHDSDFTIQCYIKWDGNTAIFQRIFAKSDGGSGANGYDLWIDPSTYKIGGSINGSNFRTTALPQSGVWTNIAWVSNATGNTIYMDGVAYAGTYFSGTHKRPPNVTTNARIGQWNHAGARAFGGQIASLQIYDRELSLTEINENYDALKDRYVDFALAENNDFLITESGENIIIE